MKQVLILITQFSSAFTMYGSALWALVSFILHLAKDTPFQWWSLYTFGISFVALMVAMILRALHEAKVEAEIEAAKPKSRWRQRIEEIEAKRRNN